MNDHMEQSCMAAINYIKTFQKTMELAAMKNDGRIDSEEEKILKRLERASKTYIKKLEKLY